MTIDLKNVAVKIERKHPHDCIISIGRLSSVEKERLLSMFPTAIHSLKYRRHESTSGTYQMTINVSIPNDFDFKVFDSDLCNLSITDCLLTSQLISLETIVAQPNWFGRDEFDSHMTIDLANVSVKVQYQSPYECTITIGRLSDAQKKSLHGMFPSAREVDGCSAITITARIPNFSCFRIHDSDMCDLVITDGMIESQRDTAYLTAVAVKVQPQSKTIRIGRICENEKLRIGRIMPPYKLNWTSPYATKSYELTIHYNSDIDVKDSNVCRLTIAYDETQSDSICILDQDLSIQNTPFSNWFDCDDSESANDNIASKEENNMIIDLKNVAVKVEHQDPHYCTISIGRLTHAEKNRLLSMFPSAIDSLQCRESPFSYPPSYQMSITVKLPSIPDFKICDSDACHLSIMDYMIISQTKSDADLFEKNWFGCVHSDSDAEIKKVRLLCVAVKVLNKQGDCNCVKIGRISDSEKVSLEQILPSRMLNFKASRLPNSSIERYEVELCVSLTDIEDSNYCIIDILYDKRNPDLVSISHQHIIENDTTLPWFDSDSDNSKTDNDEMKKTCVMRNDGIKKVHLGAVAVKVNSKYGDLKFIRIGRISKLEKVELEEKLPSNMLYFRRKVIGNFDDPNNYYELILKAPIKDSSDSIKDSNNCEIDIIYDESQLPRSVCISDQHFFTGILQPWFESDDSVMAKETVTLSSVAVKLVHKQGVYRSIQIGRISESEKTILEQILPANVLNFKSRTMINAIRPDNAVRYYEVDLPASAFGVVDSNNCDIIISCDDKEPDSIYITIQRCSNDAFLSPWFLSIAQRLAPPRVAKTAKEIIDQIKKEETEMEPQIIALSYVSVKVSPSSKTITIGRIGESEKRRIEQTFPSNMLHWKSRESVGSIFYELTLKYSDAPADIGDSNECTLTMTCGKPGSVCILKQIRAAYDNIHTWFDSKEETNMATATIEKCMISDNATIMFWDDGTKTVTKTTPGDTFDPEIGIAMSIAKKFFGSKHKFDKYVNAVYSDMYQKAAEGFIEKELMDALALNERLTTKAKEKHKAEKEAYIAAKNDPNHKGKLPELHSLRGDHSYRFAKIRKDIIMAEIEKRKAKKAATAKTKSNAKAKTKTRKKKPETEK